MPPNNRLALSQLGQFLASIWVLLGAIAGSAIAQPSATDQRILQTQQQFDRAVAATKACITVLEAAETGSTAPIFLRSAPTVQAAVLARLPPATIVAVVQQQGGWLQLQAPSGWVPLPDTALYCGRQAADTEAYRDRVAAQAAQGQPAAIALLIRLVYRSGTPFPVEWQSQTLGNLALTQPQALIAALDAQADPVLTPILWNLKAFGFTPAAQASFEQHLAKQPDSRTAQIWHTLD